MDCELRKKTHDANYVKKKKSLNSPAVDQPVSYFLRRDNYHGAIVFRWLDARECCKVFVCPWH
jgi:sarcosine oxidase delta subunit